MTKYVYVVNQCDMGSWETYYDGLHKVFSTKEAAELYVKNNLEKVFPKDRESWDSGYKILRDVQKVVLEE